MAVSDSFTEYVLEQLGDLGQVRSRKMFGGVGIYCDNLFFALIADNILYLKVDDSNRSDFEKIGSKPFKPYGEKGQTMQYYEIPADILEDRAELTRWARKSVDVAENSKAAKK
jgi:DNA transformation protein